MQKNRHILQREDGIHAYETKMHGGSNIPKAFKSFLTHYPESDIRLITDPEDFLISS